jgi:hypothetical protein
LNRTNDQADGASVSEQEIIPETNQIGALLGRTKQSRPQNLGAGRRFQAQTIVENPKVHGRRAKTGGGSMYLSLHFCAVIWRRWILVGVTLAGVLMTLAPAKAQVTYVPERIDQLDGFIRRIPCIDQNAYQVIDDRIKYLGTQLDLLRPPPGNLPNLKAEQVSARALLNSRYKKCRQKEAAERPWQTPEFLETVI